MSSEIATRPQLRTTDSEGIRDVGEWMAGVLWRTVYNQGAFSSASSDFCWLPEVSSSVQAPLEGVCPILMNPPMFYTWALEKTKCMEIWGIPDWAQGTRRAMVGTKHGFPFNIPRQGQGGLSQTQERPRISEAHVFTSAYYQLSLWQSFPNGMSKSLGQQLVAWFGRIPFSFPRFYDFFSFHFSKSIFTS